MRAPLSSFVSPWGAGTAAAGTAASMLAFPRGSDLLGVAYTASVAFSTLFLLLASRRVPAARRRPWTWLLLSLALCLAGELVLLGIQLRQDEYWPTPADVFFVVSYLATAAGVLALDRRRTRRPAVGAALGAVLDAAIVATGTGVLALVFVVLPLVSDTTQPPAARIVGTLYPLLDVLLLFLGLRLLADPGRRGATFWWVVASLSCTLAADTAQNIVELTSGGNEFAVWMNIIWAAGYLFFGCAAATAHHDTPPAHERPPVAGLTVARLSVLALAAGLPSAVLIVRAATGRHSGSVLLGLGSLVLLVMVVARIWGLLQQLRSQSAQLVRLARTDPLTGLSNRRSWDFDLERAMGTARGTGTFLLVALLDLDHFKSYNDTYGHPAGDDLLREAAQAWSAALGPSPVLARWGGEEFAALVHCPGTGAGLERLDALRQVVPHGQSVSIGVAVWDGQEDAAGLLRRADSALYRAKAGGRNRSVLDQEVSSVSSAVQSPSSSLSSSVNPTEP
ncbi:GGDEF domain-containing protein [Kineosporia succinea]|uniref:Diguanylate cyclase (GGDEF)-like protein n=1 Tax=Kineosporia succinea TaxID=84632 RepID=A0ABT9PCM1_9ACTN|nr:GGDEF domain-containing protein [Kineosporia succinea]MDP9829920.1 diguanylate cyclase (GGDEF)-like protein [Kineosporia succinea]